MSSNTFGSYGLRKERLNDPLGIKIESDNLFISLYNYWMLYHHPHQQILRGILDFDCSNVTTLDSNIRKKWSKDLPHVNIVLEKYKDAYEFFNPMQFWEKFDNEKYFELLVGWNRKNEKDYLEIKPWLNRVPIRHEKVFIQVTNRQ